MKKAVLFVTFNRLDVVQKVFEQIRKAKPPRLYVASDGPRKNVPEDVDKINTVRKWILDNIDWDCDIKTRFLDTNSGGCAFGISQAVTWFFENEKDGIILEDDCVPDLSFFSYCEELLDKYENEKKVWHITGYGYYTDNNAKESYYFAKIQHCWGWATWADRWKHFTLDLKDYDIKNIKKFSKRYAVQKRMKSTLKRLQGENNNTWAWPWTFIIVANDGYCINPYKNLVSNIGDFGVHYCGDDDSNSLNTKTYHLDKIIHPNKIEYNEKAIDYIYTHHYGIYRHWYHEILSIVKEKDHLAFTVLGIKFKIKINKKRNNK